MYKNIQHLHRDLSNVISVDRLLTDPSRLLAFGTDASFYRLIPQLVVLAESEEEVQKILQFAAKYQVAVTFRAAGTSLSGQAITDSVLVITTTGWTGHTIHQNGEKITLQPGVIGSEANAMLAPMGKKIGPDPASINTCRIGGIAANNASGMCCGVAQNTYHTMAAIRLILSDGTVLDTGDPGSVASFRQSHADLLEALSQLSRQTKDNQTLAAHIRHKFRLKNTTGYSINALVDFDDPVDILSHLMVGSEGTLGFISSITYNTVADYAYKSTALVVFPSVSICCQAVTALRQSPVAAVELMDRRAMGSVVGKKGLPSFINDQLSPDACALLIEVSGETSEQLNHSVHVVRSILDNFDILEQVDFTEHQETYASLWAIRKGLFPAVGAVRQTGTTCIIEDVAFPIEQLTEGVTALQQLFEKYHYDEALIFGHALEGNLHFVFTQSFNTTSEIERYRQFMEDVAQLVAVDFGGSLKAEHGTGRNMAPFVEMEWGKEAFQLMKAVKRLFDRQNLLNPGVILNDNPDAHITDLKPLPAADELIDKCIECGFCEPACPSQVLSLTPRKRIVLWREISRLKREAITLEDKERLELLEKEYQWQGIDTCAACGLCSIRCPVDINTGQLTLKLRAEKHTGSGKTAEWLGQHFATATSTVRAGLAVADFAHNVIGTGAMARGSAIAHKVSRDLIPLWNEGMPTSGHFIQQPAPHKKAESTDESPTVKKVVYFPSCAARNMAPSRMDFEQEPLPDVVIRVLQRAGYEVIIPDGLDNLCCGQPFQSKGYPDIAETKQSALSQVLQRASENSRWPILSDTSSCTLQSAALASSPEQTLKIYDLVEFFSEYVISHLTLKKISEPVMIHVPCSLQKLGAEASLLRVVNACADQVIMPKNITCCGFAGDKGFTLPELNASALSTLKQQVPETCREGVSTNRTCEIGLTSHSGVPYHSVAYLLDRCSSGINQSPPK